MLQLLSDIDVPWQLKGRDALNQSLYLWGKSVLANYILTMLGDRMEMAHSIEGACRFSITTWWSAFAGSR